MPRTAGLEEPGSRAPRASGEGQAAEMEGVADQITPRLLDLLNNSSLKRTPMSNILKLKVKTIS